MLAFVACEMRYFGGERAVAFVFVFVVGVAVAASITRTRLVQLFTAGIIEAFSFAIGTKLVGD
jgi:hypothetical protein